MAPAKKPARKKPTSKKPTKAQQDAEKILSMPTEDAAEEEQIKALFRHSKLKRIQALFHELEEGKGIARLQAEARIEILEREMSEATDSVVLLDWDIVSSADAKGAAY